jgi:hypothetical protein
MTRKEAEYTVELMVEDYCKGFTHKMNDEFVEALMVIMDSDFKPVHSVSTLKRLPKIPCPDNSINTTNPRRRNFLLIIGLGF